MPEFFSGGSEPFAYWLSKDDILGYLATLDFTDIIVRGIDGEHKAGPTLSFLAMRSDKENEIQKVMKKCLLSTRESITYLMRRPETESCLAKGSADTHRSF